MNIVKAAQAGQEAVPESGAMERINRHSRKALGREEVYLFSVKLCDNEIDREDERFATKTLEGLAVLFEGKSGIFDHSWSAKGQAARIYQTEVIHENDRLTGAGEPYAYLKGYAYMVRTGDNEGLIAEIEGGIKKEVSVGCAVKQTTCSVCGEELVHCPHEKGARYGGQVCHGILEEATDAYEFSFVAVPAQPAAGVMKRKGQEGSLKQLAQEYPHCRKELQILEQEARLGRRYLEGLRQDVVRLGALAEKTMEPEMLRAIAGKLEEEELLQLRASYETRAQKRYPLKTQLEYATDVARAAEQDGAFMI